MTPKLGLLAMRLNRGVPGTAAPENNAHSAMLTSYKEECDRQRDLAVKLVEDKLAKAQLEIDSLKAQLAEASKDTTRTVKDSSFRMDSLKEVHKQEIQGLENKHRDLVGAMHADMEATKNEYAKECRERVRVETELGGANKMIARLEQTIAKLQADLKAKPVVAPAAVAHKPLKIRITQRDENGRIVEMAEV